MGWGVVSLLFHLPTLGAQRLAKWLSRMRREDVVARACAPCMLTKIALKQRHCQEESLLVAMEVTRESQGGLRRRLTAIPTRFANTQSVESGDARPASA